MQSTKTSNKTRKSVDDTAAAMPEVGTGAEKAVKPRTSRSSKTKKSEAAEAGTVKHHHKAIPSVVAESAVETEPIAKAAAAAAGAETSHIVRKASHEEIAKLAHSYWVTRGYTDGHAEEDWLRAERELTQD